MTTIGNSNFSYEVSGTDWGQLPSEWVYQEATAVAVDSKDNAYVFNRGEHSIIVLSKEGKFLRSFGEGVFNFPHGISVGPDDSIYCVDAGDHTIRKFDNDGKPLMTLGEKDNPSLPMSGKPFNSPTHIAVDHRNGNFYVSDGYSNARVHKFSPDGKLLFSWGESGTDPGKFNIVHNIAVDLNGWVYVADRENRRTQVFNDKGEYETQWVNLSRTGAICVDPSGNGLIYVGEYFGGISSNKTGLNIGPRITVFNNNGKIMARLSNQPYGDESGRFYAPHGIAVDSHGDIYVAEVSWTEFGKSMDPPRILRSLQKLVRTR